MFLHKDEVILPDQGDNIIRTNESIFELNPNGLAHELFTKMKNNQGNIAQIDAESGVKEMFGAVLKISVRIACHLKKLSITAKDIIPPCTTNHRTTNHLNAAPVFYGILFSGAKVASMDPFAPDEDRIRQLDLVKPKYILAIPETVDKLDDMIKTLGLKTKIVVFGKTCDHISLVDFLVPLPEEEQNFIPHVVNDLFDMAMIVFSSGTTGSPKGICCSHYSYLYLIARGVNAPMVQLSYASLVWTSAILAACISAVFGHIRNCASGFESKRTWNYLRIYDVNICALAPQVFITMLKHGRPDGLELPHLKVVASAGSLLIKRYGQTEVTLALTLDMSTPKGLEEYKNKPTMCGKPVAGVTYKIVDPETETILGPNEPGEIRLKTKTCMLGYYNADSSDRFDSDGFLKTGDILYYDEDCCFFFVERLKEMLRYKMVAIAPVEVEGILIQHASVKIAVVIGTPTDEGDLATAVIVRSDGTVTAKELEELVASKVDYRKRLRGGIYFLKEKEIPFTPSGKIRRRAVKQHLLSLICKINTD